MPPERIEGTLTLAEETSVSKDTAPAASQIPESPQPRTGIFLPLVFGGAVASALGFFGGQIDAIEQRLGLAGSDELAQLVDAQAGKLDEQATRIAALTERVAAAEAAVLDIDVPEVDLSPVRSGIAENVSAISDLAARLETVEKRPMTEGVSADAIAAYEAELTQLMSAVETQRSEIEGLLDEVRLSEDAAAEQARTALARAALTRIITAVGAGTPFAEQLAELRANGGADIPEVLVRNADTGVPTLAALRDSFPDNARAALSAARTGSAEGSVTGFLQRQLGVRSVAPREGSDPDAILSRAEAAVRDARLGDALAEVADLPDAARAAMADWIAQAETREAATRAADDLMTALAGN